MAFEHRGAGALDYYPCRYGKSKLLFRGPKRALDQPYIAALGGSETYGKFVQKPWTDLLEGEIGTPVVNFGYLNAGVDVFLNETEITKFTRGAQATVIQLTGAHNLSNRYYAVHPRRNDRFLRASQLMRSVFKEIDFTEFNFTRHMLKTLQRRTPNRFAILADELRMAWVARMMALIERIEGPVVLLDLQEYRAAPAEDGMGCDPLLVTPEMIAQISAGAAAVVTVTPSVAARAAGTEGMCFAPLDGPIATQMPGPVVHQEVADALAPVLAKLL